MMQAAPVVFCDLDGTLVLDNSFHLFLATAWAHGGWRARLSLSRCLSVRLAGPLGGGHAAMKRKVLAWFSRQPAAARDAIVETTCRRLQPTVSVPVLHMLRQLQQQGARIVLATAAPETYARPLAHAIGADDCLATSDTVTPDWAELLGEAKAAACRGWLARQTGGIAAPSRIVVFTDHPDDLPLLRLADEVVLQGSAPALDRLESRLAAVMGGPVQDVTRLDICAAQQNGGYWLWFNDSPEGPLVPWEVKTILSKHRHARLYAGQGNWQPIGPGQSLGPGVKRRDCPQPPSSRERLFIYLRRRVLRDALGIYH